MAGRFGSRTRFEPANRRMAIHGRWHAGCAAAGTASERPLHGRRHRPEPRAKTALIKLLAAAAVILLAGGSVAAAGPIAFVGIIIPHIVRYLIGNDYRWILPYSAVFGALLLVTADLGSRYIAMPKEVPVGVMTAIIGVPFFVYIARKGRRAQ